MQQFSACTKITGDTQKQPTGSRHTYSWSKIWSTRNRRVDKLGVSNLKPANTWAKANDQTIQTFSESFWCFYFVDAKHTSSDAAKFVIRSFVL